MAVGSLIDPVFRAPRGAFVAGATDRIKQLELLRRSEAIGRVDRRGGYCAILPNRTSLTDRLECRCEGPFDREAFALHAECLDTLAVLALDMIGRLER